jgi:hypothetical protein
VLLIRNAANGGWFAGGIPDGASADEALWNLPKAGGQVVVIRHSSTEPGIGDPPGFRLDDCSTQRNLSAAGREEARRIGAAFRDRGVPVGRVLSSRWCRSLETTLLAFATGYKPLTTQLYLRGGEKQLVNDIVLAPLK